MGHVGNFRADFSGLRMGDKCVIRTDRGIENGVILCPVEGYEGEDALHGIVGEIQRRMNTEDAKRLQTIQDVDQPKEFNFCKKKIQERQLPMKLAAVEHLLGGSKVIFYFLADGRVDFRDLVKDLAQEYHTRIEMRQIGVRDEARLLADVEHCGRMLCCKGFMKELAPVTMRMAKAQKTTLDPAKISGRCGRLMCCLRFEDACYAELREQLPRKGTKVKTPQGVGIVTATETLKQSVSVDLGGDRDGVFRLSDIEVVGGQPAPQPPPAGGDEGEGPDAAPEPNARG
jgi:cell fate regulator YaaT (PSP1 superfamily)